LLPHEDEVAVGDMRLDHAVPPDPEGEELAALGRDPFRPHRDAVLSALGGKGGLTCRDPTEYGNLARGTTAVPAIGQDQRPRHALVRDPALELALSLERAQVIEGRPRGEAEVLGDLPYGGWGAVPVAEAPHEVQHFSLPSRQLFQARPSLWLPLTAVDDR